MSEQYYVDLDGKTAGPFNLAELRQLWRARSITKDTLFSKPGAVEWLPLSVIAPLLTVAPEPPPPVVQEAPPEPLSRPVRVVTERTGKGIKLWMLLFVLGLVVCIFLTIMATGLENGKLAAVSITGILGCGLGLIVMRFMRWWGHD